VTAPVTDQHDVRLPARAALQDLAGSRGQGTPVEGRQRGRLGGRRQVGSGSPARPRIGRAPLGRPPANDLPELLAQALAEAGIDGERPFVGLQEFGELDGIEVGVDAGRGLAAPIRVTTRVQAAATLPAG
jgi:hypothetical protein